jgi:hypothetical protein
MKFLAILACTAVLLLSGCASPGGGYSSGYSGGGYRTVPVRGHFRSNGSYVTPHYRSLPSSFGRRR